MRGAAGDAKAAGGNAWFSNPKADLAGRAVRGGPESVHGIVKTLVDSDEPAPNRPILGNEYGLTAQSFHVSRGRGGAGEGTPWTGDRRLPAFQGRGPCGVSACGGAAPSW